MKIKDKLFQCKAVLKSIKPGILKNEEYKYKFANKHYQIK